MTNRDHLINLRGAASALRSQVYHLRDEELSELYDICKTLNYLAEDVRKALTNRCQRNGVVGGKYLRTIPGTRVIENMSAAYVALRDVMTKEEFQKACSVSVTKLQKTYIELRQEQNKNLEYPELEQEFKMRMANVISYGPSRLQIAKYVQGAEIGLTLMPGDAEGLL